MEIIEKKRFRIPRWIFLSLAIIFNGFIIAYSCFSKDTANRFNNWVTNIFAGIINNITEKEVEVVPITELTVSLSNDKYNVIPGYKDSEIPLGSAKEITYSYLPSNATDKTVEFYTDNNGLVTLNSSGDKVSVVGMKTGVATIYGKNKSTGLISSTQVKVVDLVAPTNFDISLESSDVAIGTQATINFDIDGGVLEHNELINSRYYDIRKLTYTSSNESVATINEYGVIKPLSIGETTVTISNHLSECSRSLTINVVSGVTPSLYSDLKISGDNVCYGNDMLYDQSSHKHNHPLSIFDGDNKLNPEDFIWESSNEILVRVDKHGVMRGFRKSTVEDEAATITATSKITGQSVSYDVVVKEQLPTSLSYSITNGKNIVWDYTEFSACIGDDVVISIFYEPNISKKDVVVTSSDENVVQLTNQGSSISLQLKAEGTSYIHAYSVVNPDLVFDIKFNVLKAGAIPGEDMENVRYSIRKILGHASMFLVAEVFTVIALYMFLYKKLAWLAAIISLVFSFTLASISELIQHNIPGRTGAFSDVLIDFTGAAIGFGVVLIVYLIVLLVKKIITQKRKKIALTR